MHDHELFRLLVDIEKMTCKHGELKVGPNGYPNPSVDLENIEYINPMHVHENHYCSWWGKTHHLFGRD